MCDLCCGCDAVDGGNGILWIDGADHGSVVVFPRRFVCGSDWGRLWIAVVDVGLLVVVGSLVGGGASCSGFVEQWIAFDGCYVVVLCGGESSNVVDFVCKGRWFLDREGWWVDEICYGEVGCCEVWCGKLGSV